MHDKTIIEGLAYISLAVGERLTEERTAVYVEQLRDLGNDHAWAQAVLDLAGHVTSFPKIREIREAYRAAAARQPQRGALEEHKPSLEERAETARMRRAWMAEVFPEAVGDMNSRIGPDGHVWGTRRPIPLVPVYEAAELAGGGVPTRRPNFGDRS